jgi:peptidoglycan L-alanyl-D-glutamate endopeptidase CwlK
MSSLDGVSERRLIGVHSDLQRVTRRAFALSPIPFIITEGVRTRARQKQLFDAGASKTMNSRHLTGHAIDYAAKVGGKVRWDWPLYAQIAEAFKTAARELDVPIVWGGDWTKFRDGPHIELDRKVYPA